MATEEPLAIPKPPGSLYTVPPPAPEYAMDASALRIEVWRLKAIAEHSIPEDYQDLVRGTDPVSIQHKASQLAGLIARTK